MSQQKPTALIHPCRCMVQSWPDLPRARKIICHGKMLRHAISLDLIILKVTLTWEV